MNRREFLALIGACCRPSRRLAAPAQPKAMPVIGFLGAVSAQP